MEGEHSVSSSTTPSFASQRPAWTYVLLPGAIVIASFLLSGTYLYANKHAQTAAIGDSAPKTGTISYTVDNLKTWAGTIKGLDKKAFATCLDSDKYAGRVSKDVDSGAALGVSGTPSFFINGVSLVGAAPFTDFKAAIDNALLGPASSLAPASPPVTIVLDANDHVLGDANAPVTMVEYSDFQCPYCRAFYNEAYQEIKKAYVDTGKVKIVYRHYPLDFHPMAPKSAQAAECAGEQGKFWQMHDAIFTLQAK